jgi:hypothetical protein
MKLKIFSSLLGLLIVSSISLAQNDSIIIAENPELAYLCGTVERSALQTGDFGKLFFEEYTDYKPDQDVLNKLKKDLYSHKITIVLGAWCHDSQQQVPRMYKVLDKMDYNTSLIRLICVDKEKSGCNTDISILNIERVPTFIFYKDGNDVGRIIELPEQNLERDMLNILSK